MTGPAPDAPSLAPRRAGPRLHRGRLLLLLPVLLLLLLAGVLGTAPGLRAVVRLAEHLSAGRLEVESPSGSLLGPLQVERLRFRAPGLQLDIGQLALEWSPAALAEGRLLLDRLTAHSLQLSLPSAGAPPAAPQDLSLPFAVVLSRIELERFALHTLDPSGASPAPEPAFEFSGLAAALDSDGRHHRLHGLTLKLAQGRVGLDAALEARAPFALSARARYDGTCEGRACTLRVDADHSLLDARVIIAAAGEALQGRAELQLQPFAGLPLRALKLDVADFDPAAWQALLPTLALPRAALRLQATLDAPPQAEGLVLSGPLLIENRSPAALDRGGLPLQSLSARMHWQARSLSLDALELRLPQRGRLDGHLHWRAVAAAEGLVAAARNPLAGLGRIDARLDLADIDPGALDSRLPRQRLDGRIAIDAGQGERAQADLALTLGRARLEAHAGITAAAPDVLTLSGQLRRLDPRALLAAAPEALLDADFDLRLTPGANPRVQGRLVLPDSRYGPHPLSGRASFTAELSAQGGRLSALQLMLDLAGNRLQASGSWGAADDQLVFSAELPGLAAFGPELGGQAAIDGRIAGRPDAPSGSLRFFAEGLRLPGAVTLGVANGEASLEAGRDGPFHLAIGLSGLRQRGVALLDAARITAEGTRAVHRLGFALEWSGHDRLDGQLEGGLHQGRSAPQWSGRLTALERTGRLTARLDRPAALELASDRVSLGPLLLLVGEQGRVQLQETAWTPEASVARGSLSGLALELRRPGREALRPQPSPLVLGAEWDLRAGSMLTGTARIFREAGDLELAGAPHTRLGVDGLQLQLKANGKQIAFDAQVQGPELGRVEASALLPFERGAGGSWRPAWQAPVQGRARFDMPSIAWLARVLEENIDVAGRLDGDVELSGSLAEPRLAGRIIGQALQFALLDQGLLLRDGELDLRFDRDRLRLQRLELLASHRMRPRDPRIPFERLSATPGMLSASGELGLDSGQGLFEFRAERLPLLQHPERWLMLSGGGRLLVGGRGVEVEADLRIDGAALEFADTPAPALSEDVIVLQHRRAGAGFAPGLALRIDLGEAAYLSAMGLDTRLSGALMLRQPAGGALQATGTVATVGGSYRGYGQQLTVEHGLINFSGALDNPGLNVIALRKGLAVEAGVEILGTARRPRVRLTSEPVVPDPEKLSWMVLGRAPDAAADLGLLLPAARALLGGPGGGISDQLAHGLGLDSIAIGQGELGRNVRRPTSRVAGGGTTVVGGPASSAQVLSVGKRIGDGLMLSFEKGLGEADTLVSLTYQLSRRLSLILRGGADNAIDVEYGFSFR